MENKTCSQCKFYMQHYTLNERKIFRVFCGHCTKRKRKGTWQGKPACEMFEEGISQEDAFPRKEYLSKFLLEYMAKLELLPEIYENEQSL